MGLGRESIERRDFPIVDRGYDPAAVDAHLADIARQIEELLLDATVAAAESPAREDELAPEGEVVVEPDGTDEELPEDLQGAQG